MIIDKAEWHYEDTEKLYRKMHDIKGELTKKQEEDVWLLAANHIGLFMQWIVDHNFEGGESDKDECDKVRKRKISGAEYIMNNCDGKLWGGDIREDILPFVKVYYYDDGARYLYHYTEICLDSIDKPCYSVLTREKEYNKLKERMDMSYKNFLEGKEIR